MDVGLHSDPSNGTASSIPISPWPMQVGYVIDATIGNMVCC